MDLKNSDGMIVLVILYYYYHFIIYYYYYYYYYYLLQNLIVRHLAYIWLLSAGDNGNVYRRAIFKLLACFICVTGILLACVYGLCIYTFSVFALIKMKLKTHLLWYRMVQKSGS